MNTRTIFSVAAAVLLFVIAGAAASAQQSNSVTVQTFTYGSNPNGKFVLPPLSERYEKVLMHYKLRCPFDGPCGEWDYLMYIYLFDHTGRIDSTTDTAYAFRVDGTTPDSVAYMRSPSWRYFPHISSTVTRLSQSKLDTALVTSGTTQIAFCLDTASVGRQQFIWRKAELLAAGLKAGEITGIRFNIGTGGSDLRDFTVRMRGTARDTVTPASYLSDSLQVVYAHDLHLPAAGWINLQFPTPFVWNGTSNVVVDVSYQHPTTTPGATFVGGATTFSSAITSWAPETAVHFEGTDYIEVPKRVFAVADSAITVAFWAYGNPQYQPQDQSIFEGVDADGYRVLNVHLPWSDGTVYWDAGIFGGRYDRLQKAVSANDYEGKWSYWVFTKNVKTGLMKIYLNGVVFASANSKKKPMAGIATFKFGSAANGSNAYDGNVDEVAIFNAELDAATIKTWMGYDIRPVHPFYQNLKAYYKFNNTSLRTATDASGNGNDGVLVGPPASMSVPARDLYQAFYPGKDRPNAIFEQGTYTSRYDTTVTVDSLPNDPMQITRYRNISTKPEPQDTLTVWPAGYHGYRFNNLGQAIDSSRIAPDSVLHQVKSAYRKPFEVVNRFELGRYITPYGNGLSLGEGFTWTYDVSDFRPLLHDTVDLQAYNQQELVDMQFEFVKGTPPRDPIAVTNLWNGGFGYGLSTSIEEALHPLRVKIPAGAMNSRVRITPTGHGFGGTENCAEFCPKVHSIDVDGTTRFEQTVWRETCALNPVYPQGGTWVYSRTNWCPGAEVGTYDFELTRWVNPGDSVTLDYNITPYTWNGQGSQPYYQIETQLITYGAPNFTVDASLEQIKTPSKTDLFRRMNPICGSPIVTIRNTGATRLTSLDINYGVTGAPATTYHWTGNLSFMESADVQLGTINWTGATEHTFTATVSNPNGTTDEYAGNNTKESAFDVPPVYPKSVIFELKTNNSGVETSYQIHDLTTGAVVFERKELLDATLYRDTLTLPDGCYELRLLDVGGDGLSWWANTAAGTGSFRTRRGDNGATIKTFNPDFGGEIYQQFTVGIDLSATVPTPGATAAASRMEVFPNPSSGEFIIDLNLRAMTDAEVMVADMLGTIVYRTKAPHVMNASLPIDVSHVAKGSYVVTVRAGDEVLTRKIVVR